MATPRRSSSADSVKAKAKTKPKAKVAGKPAAAPSPRISPAHASSPAAIAAQGQLHALRAALEETARAYVARLQREIEGIAAALPARDGRKLAKVGRLLGSLHIKAHKGRRKDLKKIDHLIGELQELVES
jgi:hypothetical protein